MLHALGVPSLDALIDQVVPAHIRRPEPLVEPRAESEAAFLARLRALEARNARFRSFIGAGYYNTHTPAVIQRLVRRRRAWTARSSNRCGPVSSVPARATPAIR